MSGGLIRAAALAPVALKGAFYERVFARVLRDAHLPADRLIETNLGVRSDLRCQIPAAKPNYLFGRPDTSVAERASLRLAQTLAADCAHFVDVGANEGIYTFLAHCEVRPRPQLHWFEPDAGLFARLAENLKANGIEAIGNQAAVSAKSGTAQFFRNLSDDASGSLTDYFAGKHETEAETVRTVALADYFAEHGAEKAFLKIDVEGAGYDAWAGAAPARDKVAYLLAEVLQPEMDHGLPQRLIREDGFFAYYVRDFELAQSLDGEFAYLAPHWNWLFCRLAPEALAARLAPAGFRVTPAPRVIRLMCGVNGIFAYRNAAGPPSQRELIATRDAMAARGPDGVGEWWSADRRCALGHRRLAIQDPHPRANQPMVSADGRYVISFNGQIYNHPALKAELEAEGVRYRTTCDTETLLHLYARRGPDMVGALRGMFVFAIWDAERRSLFLARDPYGIKPIYTCDDGWTFRFASQVKALLAGGAVSRDPEPAGIVGFHLFGSVPEPFSLYRDIRALPAGHTQWIDAAGPREPKPYVSLAAVLAEGAATPSPPDELAARVRAGAAESVAAHLLADVEVGVFLSAGVNSGAMLGLMRDAGADGIRAITLSFEEYAGTPEDEAPLAAEVAARCGAHHEIRRVGQGEFTADLPAILAAMDQPTIDGVNTWFVAKAAKQAGLKVALSGLGGDELLAGYPSFTDLPRWRRSYGLLARMPGLGRLARLALQTTAPGLLRERPKAAGMLEYAGSWAGAYLLRRGLFLPHELAALMDPAEAREGLHRLGLLRRLSRALEPDPGSDVGRVCALESSFYMRSQLLRDADWAGLAHSVEIRPPLVDIALLKALAPALPGLTPGAGKRALAAAPQVALPAAVTDRAKTGFTVPTGAWMANAARRSNAAEGPTRKGIASRGWSQLVFSGLSRPVPSLAA